MGEVTTKPGHGATSARNVMSSVVSDVPDAIDETLRAEASFDPGDGAASGAPVPPAQRYRLGAELGRGGMGRVVEAFDVQLGRTVALKEVLPRGGSANIARRFAREVQL